MDGTHTELRVNSSLANAFPTRRILRPNPLRLGPIDAGDDAEQLGENARGCTPDEVSGHSVEVDREVAVSVGARSSQFTSPPLFEESPFGEQLGEGTVNARSTSAGSVAMTGRSSKNPMTAKWPNRAPGSRWG